MKPFTCTHQAQYYETDQMGCIHHSNYIRWFEECRTSFLDSIGYSYRRMEEEGILSPVLEAECKYRSMVHFEDVVTITLYVKSFNGIKLTLDYEVRDQATGELRTTGFTRHCFLNREGRPISLKRTAPDFYEKMAGLLWDSQCKDSQ